MTLDKDFGETAVAFGQAHARIIRLVNLRIAKHASVCLGAIVKHGDELAKGGTVTAEPSRLRLRPGPSSVSDPAEP